MRRCDIAQLYLVGFALMFVLFVSVGAWAQTQDAINATVFERLSGINFRLERLESLNTAALVALVANFIAHILQIRSQSSKRRDEK